jgi:choline dehydrogenase
MGNASDPDAVVDPQLKVRGIRHLRVVDASIMPVIPAAHLTAPTYMIAEKASDMIKQEWQASV